MSHVDEGMLHAYLDGALESFPASQAEQVRWHLAECDECRARLEEERAIRDEAAAILAGASLDVGDIPSFEELRARARPPRAVAAASRTQRLAWAATVVLALGTGWLLRGGIPQPRGTVDALEQRADRAAGPQATEEDSPDVVGAADVGTPPLSEVSPAPPVTRTAGAAAQDASTPKGVADRDVRVAEREVADAAVGDSTAAPEAAKAADLWAAARERRARERVEEQRVPPLPSAAVDPLVTSSAVEPRPDQARRAVNVTGSGASLRGEAPSVSGASLVVPGLPVVSVTWLDEAGLVGAVRVLQLMEGGDTLELVHLPQGVDPSLLPTRSDGRTQVLAPRDGGWLVLRGRTSADALSGLLRRLGGGD